MCVFLSHKTGNKTNSSRNELMEYKTPPNPM